MIEQGFSLLQEGHYEDAIETFSTALALDDKIDSPHRGRGLAHLRLEQADKAEQDFLAAKTLNPKEPENWTGLALSLAVQNKIYEAIRTYEELLQMDPTFVQAYIQLGLLQFKIGAISKGRDVLKQALAHRPTLEQRRMIEATLKEQEKLDKNRYYRPDFDRLNRQTQSSTRGGSILNRIRKFFQS